MGWYGGGGAVSPGASSWGGGVWSRSGHGGVFTAFNPSDVAPTNGGGLSGGNLTINATANNGKPTGGRSIAAVIVGQKKYFEYTLVFSGQDNVDVGIASSDMNLDHGGQAGQHLLLYWINDGIYDDSNTVETGFSNSQPSPTIVRVAVSKVSNRVWFAVNGSVWNNDGSADPALNIGGYDISAFPDVYAIGQSWVIGDTVTANFGAIPFAYPAPAGFGGLS